MDHTNNLSAAISRDLILRAGRITMMFAPDAGINNEKEDSVYGTR